MPDSLPAEALAELCPRSRDVARADGENDVSFARMRRDRLGKLRARSFPIRAAAVSEHRLRNQRGGDAGDRLFACWIEIAKVDDVGQTQSVCELAMEIARP